MSAVCVVVGSVRTVVRKTSLATSTFERSPTFSFIEPEKSTMNKTFCAWDGEDVETARRAASRANAFRVMVSPQSTIAKPLTPGASVSNSGASFFIMAVNVEQYALPGPMFDRARAARLEATVSSTRRLLERLQGR